MYTLYNFKKMKFINCKDNKLFIDNGSLPDPTKNQIQIEIFSKNFEDVNNFLLSFGYKNFYEITHRSNYFYKNFNWNY